VKNQEIIKEKLQNKQKFRREIFRKMEKDPGKGSYQ